ncbi:MAG: ankyrin repeat domain-containing protein [Sulfolobaceae archaeon]
MTRKGENQYAKFYNGDTPLHIASQKGRVEIVKILLERGADPWIADNRGHIPLDYAKDSAIRSLLESAMRNS